MMANFPLSSRRFLLKAPLQFRWETCPVTDLPEKDYRVRIDVCGLCRSDLHAAADWAQDWSEEGHEFAGTIVAARRPDGRFRLGQRVAVLNAAPCLKCSYCQSARLRECRDLIVNKQGYREYSDCDERSLVDAEGLDDDLLALVEPANVALDMLDAAQLDKSDRVLLLGSGTLGLIASYLSGVLFRELPRLVVGRRPDLALAASLGIPACISYEKANRTTVHGNLGSLPSVVLVTTPPETLALALELCAPGGRVLTLGLDRHDSCMAQVNVQALIFKRLSLKAVPEGCVRSPESLFRTGAGDATSTRRASARAHSP
ncbi:MAG TPA: alcohol dehydrogenase catalytic domain-containing protein [Acidobacteriota bacterium]|nr:alcohol dehydrogenase catalytic domain-containing protein [Acidobacteriota bacterium]